MPNQALNLTGRGQAALIAVSLGGRQVSLSVGLLKLVAFNLYEREKKMKQNIILTGKVVSLLFISIIGLSSQCFSESLYATKRCQTYNGPNDNSGLFYYSPNAQMSLTLDEREKYETIKERNDWVQVDVFGKRPWVKKNCMTKSITYKSGTLKKYGLVCRTKKEFKEFVKYRKNQGHILNMLADGKCLQLSTNAEVKVDVLEGILVMVKVKVHWGNDIFIGWTETTMIN